MFTSGIPVEVDEAASPLVVNNCRHNSAFHIGDPAALALDKVLTKGIEQARTSKVSKFLRVKEAMRQLHEDDDSAADRILAGVEAHAVLRADVERTAHEHLVAKRAELHEADQGVRQLANFFEAGDSKG
jgi:hypothetical protein